MRRFSFSFRVYFICHFFCLFCLFHQELCPCVSVRLSVCLSMCPSNGWLFIRFRSCPAWLSCLTFGCGGLCLRYSLLSLQLLSCPDRPGVPCLTTIKTTVWLPRRKTASGGLAVFFYFAYHCRCYSTAVDVGIVGWTDKRTDCTRVGSHSGIFAIFIRDKRNPSIYGKCLKNSNVCLFTETTNKLYAFSQSFS